MNLDPLGFFEAYKPALEHWLQFNQQGNTALDEMFYDVDAFRAAALAMGETVVTTTPSERPSKHGAKSLDLSALHDPEGCILVLDPKQLTVQRYTDLPSFLRDAKAQKLETLAVTGVGSSALGAAAFAWNIACALGEPVAAVVPGFGLADAVEQGLGGWFGYVLYDYFKPATQVQNTLAQLWPNAARLHHGLLCSSPAISKQAGAPSFRYGSPSADIAHDILESGSSFKRLVGHSKGALCIGNAIAGLAPQILKSLQVITFGCPIAEVSGPHYVQCLGTLDALGMLNAAGHAPTEWLNTQHSTNTTLPESMHIKHLMAQQVRDQTHAPR